MRIAIVSDTHLGYPRFEADSYSQAAQAFAKAKTADLVLVPGDIFDTDTPKPEVLSKAFELFDSLLTAHMKAKLAEYRGNNSPKHVPVAAIRGTHERRPHERIDPVQMLEFAGFLVNVHAATAIYELDGTKVAVQGMGGVPDAYAKAALRKLDLKPVPGCLNIFMFHQTISDWYPVPHAMSLEDLPRGFDLYVCGHIHAHRTQKFESGGMLVIPGSTVITQLKKGEEEHKGLYFFDTATKELVFEPIESRPFFHREIVFDKAGMDEVKAACVREIDAVLAAQPKPEPIIKLKLDGTLAEGMRAGDIDTEAIVKSYEGRAFVEIGKLLETESLIESLEQWRALHESKLSLREQGMALLRQKLEAAAFGLDISVNDLFDLLAEGDEEKALQRIMSAGLKQSNIKPGS